MAKEQVMTRLRTKTFDQRLRRLLVDMLAETFTLGASFVLKFRSRIKKMNADGPCTIATDLRGYNKFTPIFKPLPLLR
ncbi:MAG: hypothetical protein OJF47_002801 [Nitrospira sp.]|nr:MAG: hypothetical protein OJF47_002801 [Nitrospira sp.]